MTKRTQVDVPWWKRELPKPSLPLEPYFSDQCPACGRIHSPDGVCKPMREGYWAIIKSGYKGKAYRWAQSALGFNKREEYGTWSKEREPDHLPGGGEDHQPPVPKELSKDVRDTGRRQR